MATRFKVKFDPRHFEQDRRLAGLVKSADI